VNIQTISGVRFHLQLLSSAYFVLLQTECETSDEVSGAEVVEAGFGAAFFAGEFVVVGGGMRIPVLPEGQIRSFPFGRAQASLPGSDGRVVARSVKSLPSGVKRIDRRSISVVIHSPRFSQQQYAAFSLSRKTTIR
jgi:hypothetical protein